MKGRAVFVVGMHRSGTSMAAGLLRILGVDLGVDQELMAAAKDNPKGFFEHVALYRLNEEILSRLGGDWWQVPSFPKGWERSAGLDDIRLKATYAAGNSFGTSQVWGFKDPRLSLTLPFWRAMKMCPISAVVMVRNPLDVAKSLKKRNGFSIALGAEVWRKYTLAAIANTSGMARLPVLYEDFLGDFDAELARLADFCRLPGWKGHRDAARAFAEDAMRNQRSSVADMEAHPEMPAEVRALYAGLRKHAGLFRGPRDARAEQDLDRLSSPATAPAGRP